MSRVTHDIVVLPASRPNLADRWVIMNPATRTSIGVDGATLALLGRLETAATAAPPHSESEPFSVWDVQWFSNGIDLLDDPTRFVRDPGEWGEAESLDLEGFLDRLRKHDLLIDDEPGYRGRFARKTSLLDGKHFGNFHDQVGSYLLLEKRIAPAAAWLKQKFTDDLATVRQDNLYGVVQAPYLERYFREHVTPGSRVLDVGCGIGVYTNMMAACGCDALGIDPNKDYIETARSHAESASFEVRDVGRQGAMDGLADESFDLVFMSDALLFYFIPVNPAEQLDVQTLLDEIRRVLKPDGTFVSMEPHPMFYLAPWLGEVDHPFTCVTEYRNRRFSTTPTFRDFAHAFRKGGFSIADIDELYADEAAARPGARGDRFASEFPLWVMFELQKAGRPHG